MDNLEKLKKVKKLIDKTKELGSTALAKEFISIEEKIEGVAEELKKKDYITTELKGEKGEKGEIGYSGEKGEKGDNGIDGKPGEKGNNGLDGKDGLNGLDGLPGKDGSPDDRQKIVEKINTGKKDDLKIQLEQIEDFAKLENDITTRALGVLDKRTQFLINKQDRTGSGTVTNVTASLPLSSSEGTTPNISIVQADASTDGYLSSTDWNTFNNKGTVDEIFTARTSQVVVAGTAISVTDGEPVTLVTMSGNVTMTAAPTIAAGREGQLAIITNDDSTDTLTVQDSGVLAGSLLRLGATTRALTPGATLTLIYDSVIAAWVEVNFNTLVTVTPSINSHTINIGAGASNSQNAEVASGGTHTPTFAWTYTGVPSAGTVDVSAGGDPGTDYPATISSPFTSLVGPAFNKGTSVGTVRTFTPSITVNGVVKTTPTASVTYINRRFAGPNTQSTALSSAQIIALDDTGSGTSDLNTSQYGTFSVTASGANYIWYAHRSALTAVAFMSINSEIAAFTDIGAAVTVTNDSGFAETFRQYRTDLTGLGAVSLATSASRPTNRIYMGPATDTDPISNASILALDDTADGESVLSTTVARTYTAIKIEAGEYLWFCHPDAIADLSTIKDGTTGFAVAGSYRTDVSHTNAYGYVETYRCWRSDNTGIYPTGENIIVT